MIKKTKSPYVRDVYLGYLIEGSRRTKTDDYAIIEKWMVATEPPKAIFQWDRRYDVIEPGSVGMSFYCNDAGFQPVLGNPKKYVEKLREYKCVIGLDASPYDNMPLWIQRSQIGLNIGITYYYGSKGISVIPNIRLGDYRTLSSLEAYPKNVLIAVGTNGFVKRKNNRRIFAKQLEIVSLELQPSGICVYGPAPDELFYNIKQQGIPIYQYDSYTMKENKKDKLKKLLEDKTYER